MKDIKKNDTRNIRNQISIVIMILFLIAELFYLKIIRHQPVGADTIRPPRMGELREPAVAADTIPPQPNESTTSNIKTPKKFPSGHPRFATVSEAYFENTLFIGDSRMVGFSIYRKLEGATYYCYQSADAFTILDKEYELEPYGMISLYNLLTISRFDKIYISLGINNVAAGIENHSKHYKRLLDIIQELQPDAIIYLLANLHITSELKSDLPYLTNENINLINMFISKFADNKKIFYLDPNVLYDDEYGNMDSELSYDHAHIYVKHYDRYLYFLLTHAVVFDE